MKLHLHLLKHLLKNFFTFKVALKIVLRLTLTQTKVILEIVALVKCYMRLNELFMCISYLYIYIVNLYNCHDMYL